MCSERVLSQIKHGQRRQVTVLFADMVGYTALAEKLGEENTYHVMQQVHQELNEAVHAHSGTVQEITGDGIMALFGAPVAIENAPLLACRAAIDIQTRIAQLADKIEKDHQNRPAFRVGIHSGPLIVGAVGDDRKSGITALGDTVNLASRIESQAGAGQICMSAATHALVDGFVNCNFLGEREIKGKSNAQKLWILESVKENVSSLDVAIDKGLTPFVGRKGELSQLENLWNKATKNNIQLALISGEAGIGKSRLVHEFREHIGSEKAFFMDGICNSGSRTKPFAPLIEVIRQAFRISDATSATEARDKLYRGVELLGLDPKETLPYLLHVLGYPDEKKELTDLAHETLGIRIRDAIFQILKGRCQVSPTIITLDDMHWADSASEEFIQRSIDRLSDAPLLIIITARSGYSPSWKDENNVHFIRLGALPEQDMAVFAGAKLGAENIPEKLMELIADKSQGNPLFAEEISEHLTNSGAISVAGGEIQIEGNAKAFKLPSSVESLLMDRFDQLDDGARAMLETAAVVGARFSKELINAASNAGKEIDNHLLKLIDHEFIRAETGGETFSFKKTLARDAIYDSMLSPRRQALHKRVAEAIEAQTQGYPDEAADKLAYHWNLSENPEKGIKYLALAGEAALRIYALEEAERHFKKALDLIGDPLVFADKILVADIVLSYARVLYFSLDFFKIIDLEETYLPLFESLSDDRRLSRFLFELGYMQIFSCDLENGRRNLAKSKAIGEAANDELAVAYAMLGTLWDRSHWREPGQETFKLQQQETEWIVEIGRKHSDTWLTSKALLALGSDCMVWGQLQCVRDAAKRLIALSRETNDPRPRSMGFWMMAIVTLFSGDYESAIEQADESLRISLSRVDRATAEGVKGSALIFSGRAADGLAVGVPAIAALVKGGNLFIISTMRVAMGIGRLMSGEMAAGMQEITDVAELTTKWGQTGPRPLSELLLGEVYMELAIGKDKPDLSTTLRNLPFLLQTLPFAKSKARKHLTKSVEDLRQYKSTAHIARGLLNLAKLDVAAKKTSQARERLDEVIQLAQSAGASGLLRDAEALAARM